jgi:hypothetical protein
LTDVQDRLELEVAIGALRRDWSFLKPRLRALDHTLVTSCANLNVRLHYPALRQGQPMVESLIDAIANFIAHFCLPRTEVEEVYGKKDQLDAFEFHALVTRLNERARRLFQKARQDSGEVGELLLFILTEWMLEAPQIVAKMSLKTSSAMPVHGSDGIHIKFDSQKGRLLIYSGEAKLHKDVKRAITSAVESIGQALSFDKMEHELQLVQRNVDFSGLDEKSRAALLLYLDPFEDESNDRHEVITCLIGFDFAGYVDLAAGGDDAEAAFQKSVLEQLTELGPAMATALQNAGLDQSRVELFFLPLPSVQDARDRFNKFVGPKG